MKTICEIALFDRRLLAGLSETALNLFSFGGNCSLFENIWRCCPWYASPFAEPSWDPWQRYYGKSVHCCFSVCCRLSFVNAVYGSLYPDRGAHGVWRSIPSS
ncbi:hypothetical protein DSL92_08375 [Billgrantia gudaonensis]|uniref:Uncharacterized protein n=1 Tax=Billgrantia gudaonensis TaxID=376427 RepID=A0A3S0QRB1_9GAMM|nr:hypothetical protein DSL92_08375 [Halomonas gudaonensis]